MASQYDSKIVTAYGQDDLIPLIQRGGGDVQVLMDVSVFQDQIAAEIVSGDKGVTTDGTQTLSAKTLESVIINGHVYGITADLTLADGDVTLSATQIKTSILEVTTGHATNSIIAPAVSGRTFIVVNNDTANNVLIKKAAGTAVTIPPSTSCIVYYNGTQYQSYSDNALLTSPKIGSATEYVYIDTATQTHTAPRVTIPDLGDSADEMVLKDIVQILTNKTLTTPKIGTATEYVNVSVTAQTNADPTLTIPDLGDAADEIVCKDTQQTLTLKTLTSPTLTTPLIADGDTGLTITSANQTNASPTATIPDIGDAADEFVMKDTDQTLTLKTLTTPVIASFYQDANKTKQMTVPDTASDTLAALAATQTFTNKTLDKPKLSNYAIVNAVAASKVLTVNATPAEGETVSIGGVIYKARLDALGAGVAASAVLTSNNTECTDGITVTVNDVVYRLITTMAQANDVKRDGTTADTTLENLVKAVNGTGTEGVEYFAGTAQATGVTAGEVTSHAITFTADSVGFAGNLFPKATNETTTLDWDGSGAYFTGGIDAEAANDVFVNSTAEAFIDNLVLAVNLTGVAGNNYGTGTVINPLATAAKATSATMTATNKIKGVIGNATAISETLADASSKWAGDATFLSGGVDGTVGVANEFVLDIANSKLWVCTATNTIADANWKSASLT